MSLLREFRPALMFLGKFLALYLAGNIVYGLFIESYGTHPDPITRMVTFHTAHVLRMTGYEAGVRDHDTRPLIGLTEHGSTVLNIFEGCNGINVMIVFVAFMFAFGGNIRRLTVFVPAGLLIIHFFNLIRLVLLYHLAGSGSPQFYYYHKYVFTGILYLVVFVLWAIWVMLFYERRRVKVQA